MSRKTVTIALGGFVFGLLAAAVLWWLNENRFQNLEQRLLALETRVNAVENGILEFQSTYYESVAKVEYAYSKLKKEVEQLKLASMPPQKKKELEAWLNFLERVKKEKTGEKRNKTSQIYVA